mmetsp:Transcript_94033/g.303756  ORF Transcript_94033/g.303756 Transcript_94033/m.303756 type:complete len:209 (+) Transcript_94033:511-1137(+)
MWVQQVSQRHTSSAAHRHQGVERGVLPPQIASDPVRYQEVGAADHFECAEYGPSIGLVKAREGKVDHPGWPGHADRAVTEPRGCTCECQTCSKVPSRSASALGHLETTTAGALRWHLCGFAAHGLGKRLRASIDHAALLHGQRRVVLVARRLLSRHLWLHGWPHKHGERGEQLKAEPGQAQGDEQAADQEAQRGDGHLLCEPDAGQVA